MNVLTSKVNIPPKVYFIRQKYVAQNYTYWTKSENVPDTYYSNVLEERHFIYSFLNKNAVHNCYAFLKKFKEVKGSYPDLYDNNSMINLQKAKLNSEIYIDTDTLYSVKYRCLLNNIGLFGITDFDYDYLGTFLNQKDVFNLSVSGIDLLEGEELDYPTKIDHLNYLLDF